ncbi:sterile alpha motif domain-containing protein 11-like isoform X3 [Scleropages formosus]|uniref:sterile alpha motif domain-containing protein 11-like isoform X3 n=1 Tax=Scleropages formosus TaxID=113540 RepID=UPI0010FA76C1|nr:sterile alpha motif domain-containing protein 11 isoform X3 [Scleropages formosus]
MPAIKKETLDADDAALSTFKHRAQCLAPLKGNALPAVTPHPPSYDHLLAHHRAYLGLQDAALRRQLQHLHPHSHPHPHQHPEDLMLERFSSIPDFQPFFDGGEPCIEVECGENRALLYINKLCQGSKGPSIRHRGEWLTPNEFQFVSGRETAKDWKRSIRHKGKSLKTLMSKGILQVHPPICDCPGCRISSPVNRGRLAEKRTIPLPLNCTPKKELTLVFNSDDSEGSNKAGAGHADVKQEVELHFTVKRKSEGDLIPVDFSLHYTPEGQPSSDSQRKRPFLSDNLVGKRRTFSPSSGSNKCLLESKKLRSESPKEGLRVLGSEPLCHMSTGEHYRLMMSALNEPGSFEEQQQRLFQLASSMGVPSPADLLRLRPEGISIRNPGTVEVTGSSSQRRKQGLPQHRDAHFPERDGSHPPPLLSHQNAPHIALGPHLRPPFLGMPHTLCQTSGYGFLQPAQAELFARQQEMLRKQSLARLEMSTELLQQKELEGLQRQRLLTDPLGLPSGLSADHPALRSLQDLPEGHPLRDELSRRSAMLVLRHSATPLLSLGHQGATANTPPKETGSQKSSQKGAVQGDLHGETMDAQGEAWVREGEADGPSDAPKDSESETEANDERLGRPSRADRHAVVSELSQGRDVSRLGEGSRESAEASGQLSTACSLVGPDSPSHTLFAPGISKSEVKYLPPTIVPPLPILPTFPALPNPALPFGFPYSSPYLHAAGAVGGLVLDGEETGPVEDISKWTVEEVCSFVDNLVGCSEYTQVARRAGRILYMASLPLTLPLLPSVLRPTDRDVLQSDTRPPSAGSATSPGRASPKQENGNTASMGIHDGVKQVY